MEIDLKHDCFSCRGSHLKLSAAGGALRLSTTAGRCKSVKGMPPEQWAHDLFDLSLVTPQADAVAFQIAATPVCLRLFAGEAEINIVFGGRDKLVIRSAGATLRLRPMQDIGWCWSPRTNEWAGALRWAQYQFYLNSSSPMACNGGHTFTIGASQHWSASLDFSPLSLKSRADDLLFDVARERVECDYGDWMRRQPTVEPQYAETARRAWRQFWNLEVGIVGRFQRRALLSTKGALNAIWGWDNCFHAMAIARADLELAWQQLLLFLDRIAPTGQLPDCIDEVGERFDFCKPPLYGWVINQFIDRYGEAANLRYIGESYDRIGRATKWWYSYRDPAGKLTPCYTHGNDSGWDNATVFDTAQPVAGADLAAYLIIQAQTLARMATLLGKSEEAGEWTALAQRQLESLLSHYVHGGGLASLDAATMQPIASASLINYVPLILGDSLPATLRHAMATNLLPGGPYFGAFGPASEAMNSSKFSENGYWRGAVWAPTAILIADGLKRTGHHEIACNLARRYCDAVSRQDLFFENHSALTGDGQFAPCTLWTAAAFIELATSL